MICNINKYVDYLIEHDINEHQFLILWLVSTKDKKNIIMYRKEKGDFNLDDIEDLIERGYLNDFGTLKDNKQQFNISHYIVTPKFTETIVIDDYDAGEELIKEYPKWLEINGKKISAVACDHERLSEDYARIINNNRLEHDEVIEIVKIMKSKNPFAAMGIEKFVKSKHWRDLKELYDNESDYDTFKHM